MGSVGGFVVGDEAVVIHQRLAGSAYVFSASLPPYLATSASWALARLAGEDGRQVGTGEGDRSHPRAMIDLDGSRKI